METNPGALFNDPYFPADGRSLYFDPLYPPKGIVLIALPSCALYVVTLVCTEGALPADSLLWCRVLNAEILGCDNPATIVGDARSPLISQGALGDNHLVSTLRREYSCLTKVDDVSDICLFSVGL